jgi:hypothetical protein
MDFLDIIKYLLQVNDRHKKTFITPWGTYAYVQIPFGLMNVGATFQRDMDHAFKYMIGKTMADYQDDLIIYSKLREQHVSHLKKFLNMQIIWHISQP